MSHLNHKLQERLERKLALLSSYRPLPRSAVEKLAEQFRIQMTYNSNAIEGNSLTLKETFLVINEGITVKGKPLKDHLEAKSHQEALDFLYDLIDRDTKPSISEHLIRSLHHIVVRDIDREWAGQYRNSSVVIAGADLKPPGALDIPRLMGEVITWYGRTRKKHHPVETAALIHHRIAAIHPFFEGNGRAARLVMNVILMRAGYPLSIILKHDRKKYYRVLAKADTGEYAPLVRLIGQAVERSLDIYLAALTPKQKRYEKFLPLSELSAGTPYSAKYLNLLSRTGRLEAHKEGRNWLSSKEALNRYQAGRQRTRKPSKR
ncbi:MAG TPA: cell filamentation protein Fic [Nitrospiraceae bacterium]|nr:cell filamentation protein Fic [Nitrospiraceae bacterium]